MVLSGQYNYNMYGESSSVNDIEPTDYSDCCSFMEAALNCIESCKVNWENYNKAIYVQEATYYRDHGEDMVYEAGAIKDIINRIIDTIKRWFSKIMGVINKFKDQLSNVITKARTWAGINKKKLLDSKSKFPADAKFSGYEYPELTNDKMPKTTLILDNPGSANGVFNKIKSAEKLGEGLVYLVMDAFRVCDNYGIGIDHNDKINLPTVTAESVRKRFMGNKIEITSTFVNKNFNGTKIYNQLCDFPAAIRTIKDTQKAAKSSCDLMIKNINEFGKNYQHGNASDTNKNEMAKAVNEASKCVNGAITINNSIVSGLLSALWAYHAQIRKIARAFIANDAAMARKAARNESYSAFDGFELV